MSKIHNLQIILTQIPLFTKINHTDAIANGGQIISMINKEKNLDRLQKVSELSESEETERENPQKHKVKKNPRFQKLDIHI